MGARRVVPDEGGEGLGGFTLGWSEAQPVAAVAQPMSSQEELKPFVAQSLICIALIALVFLGCAEEVAKVKTGGLRASKLLHQQRDCR